MRKNLMTAGAVLLCAVMSLTGCDQIAGALDNPVSSYLTVDATDVTIPLDEGTYQIEASSINSDNPITYTSSNPEVATVDANGVVTPLTDGETEITVAVAASQVYNAGEQKVKVAVKQPLTFEAKEDGFIRVFFNGFTPEKPIVYTVNKGAKQELIQDKMISVSKGDKLQFESANETLTWGNGNWGVQIQPQVKTAVYGNVMSMITPDGNYHTNKTITQDYALKGLLYGNGRWEYNPKMNTWYCAELYTVNHEKFKLTLPATKLSKGCYHYMMGFTGLTEIPELPATEIPEEGYQQMFQECHSLKKVPDINVKSVGKSGLRWMFEYCDGLEESPAITAETVGDYGMQSMFYGCHSMKKANPVNIKDAGGYRSLGWLFAETALTKGPEITLGTMGDYGCWAMFYKCQSLTEAPKLPATKLEPFCYAWMFEACTKLAKAPALPATTLSEGCYNGMFYNCHSLTEAELKAESLAAGCYRYMFQNCYKLSKLTCLAKEITGYNALSYWLYDAGTDASVKTRTFVRNTANISWVNVSNDTGAWDVTDWFVPEGWTITPTIPAATAPAVQRAASAPAQHVPFDISHRHQGACSPKIPMRLQ